MKTFKVGKTYEIRIYDSSGNRKAVYKDVGKIEFSKVLNGGLGQLELELPAKFDDFGFGTDLDLGYELRVYVRDQDTPPSGHRLYSGYIYELSPYIKGAKEGVVVNAVGYASRLSFTMDKDGTDITVTRNSYDPQDIAKDVIDKYRTTVSNEKINYSATSTEPAGFQISYTSKTKSCTETLERVREMAGADWWWYVDADNVFYFKGKPATATHSFVFNRDIRSIIATKSSADVVNEFYLWNGLQEDDTHYLSNRYYNSDSITDNMTRFERLTDGRITVSGTANRLGNAYINAFKDPNISVVMEVIDNNMGKGYDIESINPGDTCQVLNIENTNILGDNMMVTSVDYTDKLCKVYLEDMRAYTSRSLNTIRRELDTTVYGDGPDTYTDVEVT